MLAKNWPETATLKEFYEVTGIEFTCTSVDMEHHILRFFNHKTTPDLPVCFAVLMSASFPCVYEALKWRKEWGKYYIHYANTRKEVDLEGIQFSDGGLLANFPIKYQGNEEIRPMYFATLNPKTGNLASLGFYLNYPTGPKGYDANQRLFGNPEVGVSFSKKF